MVKMSYACACLKKIIVSEQTKGGKFSACLDMLLIFHFKIEINNNMFIQYGKFYKRGYF